MEIPGPEIKPTTQQLPKPPQLMAMLDPNPLSGARDGTFDLMDTSWVLNLLNHRGNSSYSLFS